MKNSIDLVVNYFSVILKLILFSSFFLSSCGDSCKGHENDIKNGQIKKGAIMGMKTIKINVKYIGNCEYRCVSSVYDPGSSFSSSNMINTSVIYEWNRNSYLFVRKETID